MYVCVFFALNIYILFFYIYKIKYIHTFLVQTDTQMNMLRQYLSYLVRLGDFCVKSIRTTLCMYVFFLH